MYHVPRIQDMHVKLLSSSLNGGDLLVANDFAGVVIRDVSETAFSDGKAFSWCVRVYVSLELISISGISFYEGCPYGHGYPPIPRCRAHWKHFVRPRPPL